MAMNGEIIQQRSSYRQGLVLGLTMAEIMLLLVFCLLIAMATFLKREQDKRVIAEQKLQQHIAQNQRDRDTVASLRENSAVAEKLKSLSALTDPQEIDKYWRELVDSQAAIADLEKSGVSIREVRNRIADLDKLKANGLDADKAIKNADALSAINRSMSKPGKPPPSTLEILETIERGSASTPGAGPSGHQWPPIITLSDAAGYSFRSGSAELSQKLIDALTGKTPEEILGYIKKYDVDVIEVVGHTDEQPLGVRPTNLDRDLPSVLKGTSTISTLVPTDNAGLGLARAVSVVSVLRQSQVLAPYRILPLSGAQLVNTDETLAIEGAPRDDPQRRRIEIRLRKSVPREITSTIPSAPAIATPTPMPRPRPAQKPQPLSLTPPPKPVRAPLWTPGN
ncbi:hypothetical protein A5906_30640 [Bradyrhizobium sacchari]|uniref:OmpA family protein n=1 Tax=Bradyrhizobium sacchari TaxID=1399419 RepID=A0A560JRM6_9BRAD|nr:hypothetical protein [Bradyrhizobium sacchari]OPY98917.1 hypothetical protein A5906_30640 [Bradyrhizobium sacchari]TWB60402.1 hypothetical protein FBZ94_104627 [Bradyrhizobium sacchari]TWB73788.1 hypothetical protein FBZ95_10538 [Bradyrhizobium sacchari]